MFYIYLCIYVNFWVDRYFFSQCIEDNVLASSFCCWFREVTSPVCHSFVIQSVCPFGLLLRFFSLSSIMHIFILVVERWISFSLFILLEICQESRTCGLASSPSGKLTVIFCLNIASVSSFHTFSSASPVEVLNFLTLPLFP